MKTERMILMAIACAACIGWMQRPGETPGEKRVIGPTENVAIADASLVLPARVDTGARTTSVHAEAIRLDAGMVSFELVCPEGRRVPMERPVVEIREVRSATGSEERVFVKLNVEHEGTTKPVLVNLKDRSHMTYPMLLGRNWLMDDYIVDISKGSAALVRQPEQPMRLASRD